MKTMLITNPSTTFSASSWTISPSYCGTLTMTAWNYVSPTYSTLDSTFISFAGSSLSFTVSTADLTKVALSPYIVRIKGTLPAGV
jgi:hypothetical protein